MEDAHYYRDRELAERAAARRAVSAEARAAHEELARRYAALGQRRKLSVKFG